MPHFNPDVPVIPGFDNPPQPKPRRRRAPSNQYLHVREVKGQAFQARVWLGAHCGGSLNLGLFTLSRWETREHAEWAAGRASLQFRKRYRPGVALRSVIESLIRDDFIPGHVLPPRVCKVDGGYAGKVRLTKRGQAVETPAFACPWAAYECMCAKLAALFPRQPSKSEVRERARCERRLQRERLDRERYAAGTLFEVEDCAA